MGSPTAAFNLVMSLLASRAACHCPLPTVFFFFFASARASAAATTPTATAAAVEPDIILLPMPFRRRLAPHRRWTINFTFQNGGGLGRGLGGGHGGVSGRHRRHLCRDFPSPDTHTHTHTHKPEGEMDILEGEKEGASRMPRGKLLCEPSLLLLLLELKTSGEEMRIFWQPRESNNNIICT